MSVSIRWVGKSRFDTVDRWSWVVRAASCERLVVPIGDSAFELTLEGQHVRVEERPLGTLRQELASMPIGAVARDELTSLVGDYEAFLPGLGGERLLDGGRERGRLYVIGVDRLAGLSGRGSLARDLVDCARVATARSLAIAIDWE